MTILKKILDLMLPKWHDLNDEATHLHMRRVLKGGKRWTNSTTV